MPPLRVLMPGATGKLGRLLRAVWAARPPQGLKIVPLARRPAPGARVWMPGADAPAPADAVLALWGAVPGGAAPLEENARLARAAAELARQSGAARVLHLSSAAVYGRTAFPWTEETLPDPVTDYGRAKLEMERSALAEPGAQAAVLRLCNVAGADSLFAALERGGTVTLDRFADGQGPRRSYIGAGGLAQVLEALLRLPAAQLPGVLNVAAEGVCGMDALVRAAGLPLAWRAAPAGALPVAALDLARLRALGALPQEAATPQALVRDWRRWRTALAA